MRFRPAPRSRFGGCRIRISSSKSRSWPSSRREGSGIARLLRLDVELFRQLSPTVLFGADELARAFRRAGAVRGQAERQQALLNVRSLEIVPDLAVDPLHDIGRCARGRDDGKPAV